MNALVSEAPRPTLPNLLIIGAAKAGTTSLHYYLSKHPQIHMSKKKELNFFNHNMREGIEWYKSNFDARYPVNGESTPAYTRFPRVQRVPEMIREAIGTPKIIYMVRDPIDRLVSQYLEQVARWRETRSLDEVLTDLDNDTHQYLDCSSYFLQLSQYLKWFSPEGMRVVLLERLAADPKRELKAIFRFLGVDDDFWSADLDERRNESERKVVPSATVTKLTPAFLRRQLSDRTWMPWHIAQALNRAARIGGRRIAKPALHPDQIARLENHFRHDVGALRQFLGDPLPEWRAYG